MNKVIILFIVIIIIVLNFKYVVSTSSLNYYRNDGIDLIKREEMKDKVRSMFFHGYDNYMKYAFPKDELKPLSASGTNSLAELGNSRSKASQEYTGVALTLIDSLDTIAILGNSTEFTKQIKSIINILHFDFDVRVHLFEVNIRLLGGLLSAHLIAADSTLNLMLEPYEDELLDLAYDLGKRMLRCFTDSNTELPFAWFNMRKGVLNAETSETCTAGVGTLLLEFGLLSTLTNDDRFLIVADKALMKLWSMRSSLNLLGNTLDGSRGTWLNPNSGIGAGVDSFFEYLFKSYILFGSEKYNRMFEKAYSAVMSHLYIRPWYIESSMYQGLPTQMQMNSLQAFWPGLQIIYGKDFNEAKFAHEAFHTVWNKYGALPERFMLKTARAHSSERYYPLRPEFVESTYLLYRATKHPYYLNVGIEIYNSLQKMCKTEFGYASVRNVVTKELEDVMPSFFLAETVKYLYLLFDEENWVHSLHNRNYIFTTEGHLFPITIQSQLFYAKTVESSIQHTSSNSTCMKQLWPDWNYYNPGQLKNIPILQYSPVPQQSQCYVPKNDKNSKQKKSSLEFMKDFDIRSGDGSFHLVYKKSEETTIRNLGTPFVEIVNSKENGNIYVMVLNNDRGVLTYNISIVPLLNFDMKDSSELDTSENLLLNECKFKKMGSGALFNLLSYKNLNDNCKFKSEKQWQTTIRMNSKVETKMQNVTGKLCNDALGEIVLANPVDGCSLPEKSQSFEDKIVLVIRGGCTFQQKVSLYSKIGAKGIIIGNENKANELFMMGPDGSNDNDNIPAIMVTKNISEQIKKCLRYAKKVNAKIITHFGEAKVQSAKTNVAKFIKRNGELVNRLKVQPKPFLLGNMDEFLFVTQGGWYMHVHRNNGIYQLHLNAG